MTIINESDLYLLIIKSQLPATQNFERWVIENLPDQGKKIDHNHQLQRKSTVDII
jgi:prophage antirepressor-like protein